jgi:anti-repressor protein
MIDARRLHEWLGNKDAFANWMRDRLEQYSFVEGADYFGISQKTGGRPRKDYFLTVNMAKELAMVERSQIGQLTRRYFIQMEQAAKDAVQTLEDLGRPELTPQRQYFRLTFHP